MVWKQNYGRAVVGAPLVKRVPQPSMHPRFFAIQAPTDFHKFSSPV